MDMFVSSTAFAAPTAMPASPDAPAALIAAATSLLDHLALGRTVDTPTLRAAMSNAFGGSDAEGAWDWKTGYDASEAATVLFLRRFGPGMRARTDSRAALLAMLAVKRRAMGTPDRHAKRALAHFRCRYARFGRHSMGGCLPWCIEGFDSVARWFADRGGCNCTGSPSRQGPVSRCRGSVSRLRTAVRADAQPLRTSAP